METHDDGLVDLSKYDRSDAALLNHWRGFDKLLQPDGTVVALCEISNGRGRVLGPCADGRAADHLISDFYDKDKHP